MNARKVLVTLASSLLFGWFLHATLPAFNTPDMSAYQAFILTPFLIMLGGLGGLGIFQVLNCGARTLQKGFHGGPTQCFSGERRSAQVKHLQGRAPLDSGKHHGHTDRHAA